MFVFKKYASRQICSLKTSIQWDLHVFIIWVTQWIDMGVAYWNITAFWGVKYTNCEVFGMCFLPPEPTTSPIMIFFNWRVSEKIPEKPFSLSSYSTYLCASILVGKRIRTLNIISRWYLAPKDYQYSKYWKLKYIS